MCTGFTVDFIWMNTKVYSVTSEPSQSSSRRASSFKYSSALLNIYVISMLCMYVYIWLTISSYCGSIPLALGLIGRDGGLSALCHGCGFACQQRVLETFPGPGYLHSEDGVVWLWHPLVNLYIYIYIYIYIHYIHVWVAAIFRYLFIISFQKPKYLITPQKGAPLKKHAISSG